MLAQGVNAMVHQPGWHFAFIPRLQPGANRITRPPFRQTIRRGWSGSQEEEKIHRTARQTERNAVVDAHLCRTIGQTEHLDATNLVG